MASKRSSSTSEEEEEEKKEEEAVSTPEESSEKEEESQKNKSPPPAVDAKASSNKLVATQSSSPKEEEDGSDSELESESDSQSRANIKYMEETPARSKAKAPSTSKRQREMGLENKEAKRAKKKEAEPEEEEGARSIGDDFSKKQMFQRIWSEEDELVFLKGIADYSAKHGCVPYPNGDMNEFHDSIRNSLHCEFSRGQLTDKIRRLKKKYENNVSRAKSGEDPSFHKRHELKAFELSKNIWGVVEGNRSQQSNKGKNQKLKANEAVMPAKEPKSAPPRKHSSIITDFAWLNESVGLSPTLDRAVEIGLRLLSESAKADLEGQLEEIQEEEFQLYLKKVELIQMQVKAAMHAFRSRNH